MKSLIFMTIATLLFYDHTDPGMTKQEIQANVQGSWELVSYIDHESNSDDWQSYKEEIVYQKHITNNHFTWFKYNKTRDQLLGMGGGSYLINDKGQYVENIEFFFPPGSSELGQSIPFDAEFKEGKWYHTGEAKEMEIGEDGAMVMVGSIKIEEIWSPMIPEANNAKDLIGTWDLEKYRDETEDLYIEYPIFTGYMKLITPTHFVWVKYDREGDQIFAAGAGPYEFDGETYTENLHMAYPDHSGLVNSSIEFLPDLNRHKWLHYGKAPVKKGENTDTLVIDEVWKPHVCDRDMEFSSTF
jgi:hypothetical protein